MNQHIFKDLFIAPYEHGRWLKDQQTLIDRMKQEEKSDYMDDQIRRMESFQKGNQCSIVMIEILQDRLKKYCEQELKENAWQDEIYVL